jgi:hypothetical protein
VVAAAAAVARRGPQTALTAPASSPSGTRRPGGVGRVRAVTQDGCPNLGHTSLLSAPSPPGCGAQPATRSQRRRCGMSGRVQSAEPAVRTSLGCTSTAATAARARARTARSGGGRTYAAQVRPWVRRRSSYYVRPYCTVRMAMRQPGPPHMNRSGRRSWIQIPILLLLMKVFSGYRSRFCCC